LNRIESNQINRIVTTVVAQEKHKVGIRNLE